MLLTAAYGTLSVDSGYLLESDFNEDGTINLRRQNATDFNIWILQNNTRL